MDGWSEILNWLLANGGVFGPTTAIFAGLYLWERKGRGEDRKEFDSQLSEVQREHNKDLKLVLPLVEKFSNTMDLVLPMIMRRFDGRDK